MNRGVNVTQRLAVYVSGLGLSSLPEQTLEDARLAILDSIGCGLAGSGDEGVSLLCRTLSKHGEKGNCICLDGVSKYAPRQAALVNGSMIHALEMDDTHSFSSVHAGGPVVAAVLAAGFQKDAGDRDFLEAVICGYEIACRLGMALRGPDPYHRGFHPTGICGLFGAATACGKIFGLDAAGFQSAWGIAGSMAAGLMSYLQNGAWTKKMHPGWASQAGYMAAALAAEGYLGPDDIFGGRYNFPEAYSDHFKPDLLTEELGCRFEISRMSYKAFACCRTIHAPVTAALEIAEKYSIDPGSIEEIEATIAEEDLLLVVEPLQKKREPETVVQAQFSMPFGVALSLVKGSAWPDQYSKESLNNPMIKRLAGSFSYRISDEFTAMRPLHFPCEMRIKANGKNYTAFVKAPLGDYTNPLTRERMVDKFYHLSHYAVSKEKAEQISGRILGMGKGEGALSIMDVLP